MTTKFYINGKVTFVIIGYNYSTLFIICYYVIYLFNIILLNKF